MTAQKPILMAEEILIQNLKPKAKTPEPKYRKVFIKNNRGPWKIANMSLKRSSQADLLNNNQTETSIAEQIDNYLLVKEQGKDGLLVSKQLGNDSSHGIREPSDAMKVTETILPLLSDTLIEQKFINNLPKINLFGRTVDKKNLRNFKINSDVDVIDLMQEDSIPASQHLDDRITLASDARRTRSPMHQSIEDSGEQKRADWGPIKIFVFLNRNRNRQSDQYRTDSSNHWYNIAAKPEAKNVYEVVAETLPPTTSTTTTTTTTTTSTTTPAPTTTTTSTTQSPIRRILKKFDLDEFQDKIAEEVIRDMEEKEREDSHYLEPSTEPTTEDTFTLSSFPISRNWTFNCGKRKGFFADVDNDCRTYYQCSVRGRQRWECPPGTRFNQFSSTCDWLENVNCLAFRDLINEKIVVDQHIDRTSTTTPLPTQAEEPSTARTTIYESEYEDTWE